MSDSQLCCVEDYENEAERILPKNAWEYYRSGACQEFTLSLNLKAFYRLRIRPRMLRDVSDRSMKCRVMGNTISAPIGIAPTGMQRMAHPDGECATARAAGNFGTIFILSTMSTSSIEEVADAAPGTVKWFQLYVFKKRDVTVDLVRRAEKRGFKAIVVTVDVCQCGKRYSTIRTDFRLPPHLRLSNFEDGNSLLSQSSTPCALFNLNDVVDDSLDWNDIKWLMSITKLPIILKGILTAEDAQIGLELGVAGIYVSNHGGRQLDTCPASIEALPEIIKAVNGRCDVYLDGGVTTGTAVFKALALGAKMVFIGRPAIWGLTKSGEKGVQNVLEMLADEFQLAMGLSGCTTIRDIKSDMVVHESMYSRF